MTQALTEVEMQSPDPQGLAEHWGKITGIAVSKTASGEPELKLPNASFRFVKGASDLMSGLTFRVADIAKVRDAAKAKGCKVSGDTFDLCGVTFQAGGVAEIHRLVVPANAGTHNHRCLWRSKMSATRALSDGRGVWVPAFAGTTP